MRVFMLSLFSCVWLCVNLWTVACQAPLFMGFSRQEYWSRLPCSPPGDLPDPGIEPTSLTCPALAGRFFTTSATWEAPATHIHVFNSPPKSPPRGSRLPHNIEQKSLCHTVGPYLLPILNAAVCTCLSQTPEKCECQCITLLWASQHFSFGYLSVVWLIICSQILSLFTMFSFGCPFLPSSFLWTFPEVIFLMYLNITVVIVWALFHVLHVSEDRDTERYFFLGS